MIQIYNPDNDNFEYNGDMTLFPSEAKVHVVLGSEWEASLTHPIDDEGRWTYIVIDAVVKMPSFNGDQLWRIIDVDINDTEVTASLQPIFFDAANEVFLTDVRPTNKLAQDALDILMEDTKYSGSTDLVTQATAYYEYKNLMEALNGNIDQSFVNRWGGEIIYDNFTVIINERAGEDNGVEIRYGKNIPENGFRVIEDMSGVVTRVYPKGYNGVTMTDSGYVDSEHIGDYPIIRASTITYSNIIYTADMTDTEISAYEDDEDAVLCSTQDELDAALTEAVEADYDNGLDLPSVTISADLILLQNTDQYQDVKVLEEVSLGDTVKAVNTHIGIETSLRVIELEYDSLTQKVSSVALGDYEYDYFTSTSKSLSDLEEEIGSSQTVLQAAIANATSLITGNSGGYVILYDTNGDKKPDEFLVMDEDDINEAEKLWRWNLSGMGYSSNGYNGDYATAITMDGAIVADFITAGTMYADRIKGGTLTLGGEDNLYGVLKILDSDGNEIGTWDDNGISATGTFTTTSSTSKVTVGSGAVKFMRDEDELGRLGNVYTEIDDVKYFGIHLGGDYDASYIMFDWQKTEGESTYTAFMKYDYDGVTTGYEETLHIYSYVCASRFIKSGSYTFTDLGEGEMQTIAITFTQEYEHAPKVFVTAITSYPQYVQTSVSKISETGCYIAVVKEEGAGDSDVEVNWIIVYFPDDE